MCESILSIINNNNKKKNIHICLHSFPMINYEKLTTA